MTVTRVNQFHDSKREGESGVETETIHTIIHKSHETYPFPKQVFPPPSRFPFSRQPQLNENRENQQKSGEETRDPFPRFYHRVLLGYPGIHLVHTWIRNVDEKEREMRDRERSRQSRREKEERKREARGRRGGSR